MRYGICWVKEGMYSYDAPYFEVCHRSIEGEDSLKLFERQVNKYKSALEARIHYCEMKVVLINYSEDGEIIIERNEVLRVPLRERTEINERPQNDK